MGDIESRFEEALRVQRYVDEGITGTLLLSEMALDLKLIASGAIKHALLDPIGHKSN